MYQQSSVPVYTENFLKNTSYYLIFQHHHLLCQAFHRWNTSKHDVKANHPGSRFENKTGNMDHINAFQLFNTEIHDRDMKNPVLKCISDVILANV